MLVGKTERRFVPHEDGAYFEFRRLSGPELDEAEEKQTKRALELVKDLPPAAMQAIQGGAGAPREAVQGDRDKYDKDTLVAYAVAAWSYTEPCSDENKARLDAATRDWAASVVLEMNVRPPGEGGGSGGNSSAESSRRSSSLPTTSAQPESS